MGSFIDLTGQQFRFLTVLRRHGVSKNRITWVCHCVCGKKIVCTGKSLRNGGKRSCGCKKGEMCVETMGTHGVSRHPLYGCWLNMIRRCSDKEGKNWRNYGGRGITVCQRWMKLENFIADMGDSYVPGLTLDREDNDLGYSKGNCRWVDYVVQNNNQRGNAFIDTPKGRMTISQASQAFGINRNALQSRLRRGMSVEEALDPSDQLNRNIIATPKGEMHVSQAAREFGMNINTLRGRLRRGMSAEKRLDPSDQANRNIIDTPKGKMHLAQAAREFGLNDRTLRKRLFRLGWSVKKALLTPVSSKRTVEADDLI